MPPDLHTCRCSDCRGSGGGVGGGTDTPQWERTETPGWSLQAPLPIRPCSGWRKQKAQPESGAAPPIQDTRVTNSLLGRWRPAFPRVQGCWLGGRTLPGLSVAWPSPRVLPRDKLAAQVLRVWDSVKARPHIRWVLSIVAGRPLAWNLPWSPF